MDARATAEVTFIVTAYCRAKFIKSDMTANRQIETNDEDSGQTRDTRNREKEWKTVVAEEYSW
jgi:hypothetical protein